MTTAPSFNTAAKTPQELGQMMLEELQKTPNSCDYARVRDLLERGASADVYNKHGEWPLQACICYGHGEIGLLLVEKGADVDFRAPDSPNSPLYLAAHNARVEMVKALLDRGAKLDTTDENGTTALQEAARRQADNEYTIKTHPDLCDNIKPDPRVTVVKFKAIQTLIEAAAETRAEAVRAETRRQQAEADWRDEGLPLRQPMTVSRQTIKLKS